MRLLIAGLLVAAAIPLAGHIEGAALTAPSDRAEPGGTNTIKGESTRSKPPRGHRRRWERYPYCRTWSCVKHTRAIRKKRRARCMKHSRPVGASVFGGAGDSGSTGYRGDNLYAHPDSYAELRMGSALGGLPHRHRLDLISGSRIVRAYKRDIGLGGGPVGGLSRDIDLWYWVADRLGVSGLAVIRVTHHRCY